VRIIIIAILLTGCIPNEFDFLDNCEEILRLGGDISDCR
jgi:hypothetical protein